MADTDRKLIPAMTAAGIQVTLHDILFTCSMFLGEKPAAKKRIKIQITLLLERHAPPFAPDLSPCMRPPACGMAIKLPHALYFRAAK
ncbi:hypothetical protein [Janthinobacterium sp. PAMC25594]|uniref:hypothetical protein n=1 Tax=Janthinobacterium sp. PAMC25594 TaxID=2861284 RepID=UPI001C62989F|nr:hypothetical protein [Janthinobacterium sp. PAMC25594]QYG07069.1 hypothetical protein KY494_28425 [Janthinobacterium sp. PAMC25594]